MPQLMKVLSGLTAAVAFGFVTGISEAGPVSASTTPVSASASTALLGDVDRPVPMPLFPIAVGLHLVDVLAEGIAYVVEIIATPAPIAIPACHTATNGS